MANFGDIAGGLTRDLNVRTIADVLRIKMMNEESQRAENRHKVWLQEQADLEKPIFVDRLKETMEPEVFGVVYNKAKGLGLIYNNGTGEYVKKSDRAVFKENYDEATKGDILKATLASSMRKEKELSAKMEEMQGKGGKQDEAFAQLEQQAILQKQTTDGLRAQLPGIMQSLQMEALKKKAMTVVPQGSVVIDENGNVVAKGQPKSSRLYPTEGGYLPEEKALGKRPYAKPEKAEKAPKITANVATNPVSGQDEYLMTDGSFSGKVATSKAKPVTIENMKHLADMVSVATERGTKEPTASDSELIRTAAEPLGYSFEKTTKDVPGALWGTNKKESWDLVPKSGTSAKSGKKDSFGYIVGQTTTKGGKTYKYIGNNKWQAQ